MGKATDLEINIGLGNGGIYPVELRFTVPDPNGIEFREWSSIKLPLDELGRQPLQREAYGERLWCALFGNDTIGRTYGNCRAIAHSRSLPLRLRLSIHPNAPALYQLPWELLRDLHTHSWLATDQRTPFSRYLASAEVRPTPPPARGLDNVRAVIFIANPDDLSRYRPEGRELEPVKVAEERQRARDAMQGLEPREVLYVADSGQSGKVPRATLENLVKEVSDGCDILYLVCHGAYVEKTPVVFLETPEGNLDEVPAAKLVQKLENLQSLPRLLVLASCQSAGKGSSTDQGVLAAFGPLLARAGIPAVLAMQGNVKMDTVAEFMRVFFRELLLDGQIDRAVAAARNEVEKQADWWVPVLFMRLAGGNLWTEAPQRPAVQLGELLAYLDTLKAKAENVPSYFRGARMERVRVRVRVSSERQKFDRAMAEERERLRRQGFTDDMEAARAYEHRLSPVGPVREEGGEERPRVEVLDWDRDVREKLRRGVLVGDPGLGKTWLLKWEAVRYAGEAAGRLREVPDPANVIFPVYLRLSDVAAALLRLEERRKHIIDAPAPTLPEAVIESLRSWQLRATDEGPSQPMSPQMLDMLRTRLGSEQAVLLLDAFDEVPDEHRKPLLNALQEWVPRNPQALVLFTSRVVGYQQPWPIPERSETEREMELLPFADDQMDTFVDAFFASEAEAARGLRELLRRAPQIRGMAQVPLLLSFLCALYREERGKPVGERHDLARLRRTDLYRIILQRLLSGQWKDPPLPPSDPDAKLELLEPVAFRLFRAGKEQFTMRDLRQSLRSVFTDLYPGQGMTEAELTARVEEWTEQDGVLVKAGAGDEAPYLFLHLTFQEYLAARHLAQRINDSGWDRADIPSDAQGKSLSAREFVDRKAWLPAWQEVVVLLAGNLDDPVPLLEMLADDGKDDIFCHRLALAALCLPEIKELQDTT
jgi:hypothetical protein